MNKLWQGFAGDESGATSIEYAFIASLIGLAIVGGAQSVGIKLSAVFTNVSAAF